MAGNQGAREEKRVLMEEITKSTTISDSWPVPVTEEASAHAIRDNTNEWLISITNESKNKIDEAVARSKHKICKAPVSLRKSEKNSRLLDPEVVAIGPYHRGKDHLKPMEDHKRTAAIMFASGGTHSIGEFYYKVQNAAREARTCYDDEFELSDEEFTLMLFFDGCFVLHFINLFLEGKLKEMTVSTHLHRIIIRDMFLLENQLPFIVLRALINMKPVNLRAFIEAIVGTTYHTYSPDARTPCHLLDFLRTEMLGRESTSTPHAPLTPKLKDPWLLYLSAMELREVGIKFRKNDTNHLRDIHFQGCITCGKLSLPKIIIDDQSRSKFLNMIALEISLGNASDKGIISFVWFLDCLLGGPEDVKELRAQEILFNGLGSDEQVAELFHELATDLAVDPRIYSKALKGINDHCESKVKVSVYNLLHTHFNSPWTAIAFIATVFLLVLTVIQTIFTVFPRS